MLPSRGGAAQQPRKRHVDEARVGGGEPEDDEEHPALGHRVGPRRVAEDEDRKVDQRQLEEVDRERVLAQSDEGGVFTLRFETGDPSVEVAEAEVRLVGATKVIERFPSIK